MIDNNPIGYAPHESALFTRRAAFAVLGACVALTQIVDLAAPANAQSQPKGTNTMSQNTMNQSTVGEIVAAAGLLAVAQWEAKEGQADAIAAILRRYLPQAQSDPGVKLFLVGRGKDNPAQFLFYELFVDDAAFATHQTREYFKTLIAGEALPLLAKRERTQYALL
jgi:quinol monooxygenase YgiN